MKAQSTKQERVQGSWTAYRRDAAVLSRFSARRRPNHGG